MTEAPSDANWLERRAHGISQNADLSWGAASVAAAAASSLIPRDSTKHPWVSDWLPWILLIAAAAMFVAAGVASRRRVDTARQLRARLVASEAARDNLQGSLVAARLTINRMMESLCQQVGEQLGATVDDRVTIYSMHQDGYFVRLARRSHNPRFQTSGRVKYPSDEGIVAEAWERVTAVRTVTKAQTPTREKWVEVMNALSGIPKKTLDAMVMQSRVLIAMRIEDGHRGSPCAVLVFESELSMNPLEARFSRAGLRSPVDEFTAIFNDPLGVVLAEVARIASSLVQQLDPDFALREGF